MTRYVQTALGLDLEAAGRDNDALAWFHRTHAIDSDELTDAAARADLLERRQS